MKPRERRETGAQDMFRSRLDQIINLKRELVILSNHYPAGRRRAMAREICARRGDGNWPRCVKVEWREVSPGDLREKVAIFSDIYAPRIQPAGRYSQISPVNTFRLILRDYFNVAIEP